MRQDRGLRLVSPSLEESELRAMLARAGASPLHIEELLRGNRMAHGGHRTDYLFFTEEDLLRAGLAPEQRQDEAFVSA